MLLLVASSSRQCNGTSDRKQSSISQHLHRFFPRSIRWKDFASAAPEHRSAVDRRGFLAWALNRVQQPIPNHVSFSALTIAHGKSASPSSPILLVSRRLQVPANQRAIAAPGILASPSPPTEITIGRWLWRRCENGRKYLALSPRLMVQSRDATHTTPGHAACRISALGRATLTTTTLWSSEPALPDCRRVPACRSHPKC
jgi:hypothetical protein